MSTGSAGFDAEGNFYSAWSEAQAGRPLRDFEESFSGASTSGGRWSVDNWTVNWGHSRTRLPVGWRTPERLQRLKGAFEALSRKLPPGTREIQMNQQDFERLQDRLMLAGIHDEAGRPLWYSSPVTAAPDIPPGKIRFLR